LKHTLFYQSKFIEREEYPNFSNILSTQLQPQNQYQFSLPTISCDEIPLHNNETIISGISKFSVTDLAETFKKAARSSARVQQFYQIHHDSTSDYLTVPMYNKKKNSIRKAASTGSTTLDSTHNNRTFFSTHQLDAELLLRKNKDHSSTQRIY
jgi:hypothetical protein